MKAFITGSHAYGTPHEASDIDLVVLMSPGDMDKLARESGMDGWEELSADYKIPTACLRFGKLNIICVTEQVDYDVWKEGTEELMKQAPTTREVAKSVFQRLRSEKSATELGRTDIDEVPY